MSRTEDLQQIEYRRGLLESGMQPNNLPVRKWRGAEIPAEVRECIREDDILNLGGVYGEKEVGDPIEYDHLRLVLTDAVVEIEVFNRGIMLLMTNDEKVARIHRVLCTFDAPATDDELSMVRVEKIAWSGQLTGVQPRIRLLRSFDQRHHSYHGYVLRVYGKYGQEFGEFLVAVGQSAHKKHRFRAGMELSGQSVPVADPRLEAAGFYRTSRQSPHGDQSH